MAALLALAALASAVILVVFVSGAATSWDGTLQRLGVSLPLVGLIAVTQVTVTTTRGSPEITRRRPHPRSSARI